MTIWEVRFLVKNLWRFNGGKCHEKPTLASLSGKKTLKIMVKIRPRAQKFSASRAPLKISVVSLA